MLRLRQARQEMNNGASGFNPTRLVFPTSPSRGTPLETRHATSLHIYNVNECTNNKTIAYMKKLFTLFILLCLLPLAAWAQAQTQETKYIYYTWDNDTQTCIPNNGTAQTATVVTTGVTQWGGDESDKEYWYVVNDEINITDRITVTGNVHLILADGCNLTASKGINVSAGNSLSIYGQTNGSGALEATRDSYNAGIGGGFGSGGSGGEVTIHGGEVTATGGNGGAGIGGGYNGSGGEVTIYGGTVTATGESSGAGIGGGQNGNGGAVTISGGTVTATGYSGAGIGSGYGGSSGTFSTGTDGHAFIIASSDTGDAISDQSGNSNWSGVIFEGDEGGLVYGSPITLTTDATIPAGKTLTVGEDKTLTIGKGVTLTNEGTLTNNGKIVNYGTIDGTGTVPGNILTGLTEDMITVAEATYTGEKIEPEVTVSNFTEDDYDVTYSNNTKACDATEENAPTVTVTPKGTNLGGDPVNVKFTIAKATPTITLTVPTGDDLVYDGTDKKATATVKGVENESEELTATIAYYSDDTYQTKVEETKNAGTYYVKATFVETANYVAAEETASFTIAKASATLSFAKKEVLAVMGETVENTLNVTPAGVAVLYSSSANGVATVDASGVITLVGAGTTTITATVDDPNYQGEAAYTLTVTLAPLGEGEITAEGETNISIEMDGTSFELTAKVIADDLGTNGTWTWASGNTNVATVSVKGDAASGYSLRATTDPKTSTAIVTPVAAGTATITATYTDSEYTGSVDFTVTITEPEPEEPKPPIDQPSYYNIYVEDVCDGVDITTSKNVVREGGSISLYVEKDTANYTFDNFKVYYKRNYYGPWEILEEGVQPGEYPINNIWTHIYVKAEGAEEKEDDPTGMEQVEGVKVYTKDGSLYVQTPQRETVIIVSMTGAVVKSEEQVGLKQYHGLQPGIYIVRVGDRTYKLRL